jgi:hypothetical protein
MLITIPRRNPGLIKPPPSAKINWSHPISNGIVAQYLFNEGGGTNLNDGVNGTYNATIVNPTDLTWTSSALYGIGLSSNGAGTGNCTMSALPLGTTGAWSWDTYVLFNSGSITFQKIFGNSSNAALGYDGATNVLNFFQSSGHNSTGTIPLNTWTHLALTFNGTSTLLMYINGVLNTTVSLAVNWTGTGPNSMTSATASGSSQTSWRNPISYMRFWNRPLRNAEVVSLYTLPFQNMLSPSKYSVNVPAVGSANFPIFNSAALLMEV